MILMVPKKRTDLVSPLHALTIAMIWQTNMKIPQIHPMTEIIGTLSVYITTEICKDNSDESAHNCNDSEKLVTGINGCIKRL
jgi:hypothetical protein